MFNKRIAIALKIALIFFLVLAITALVLLQWKSDVITKKVITLLENRLEEPIQYDQVSLEMFRYFPCAAIQLKGLMIGSEKSPFIKNGRLDLVIKLFPLLNEKIVIDKIKISDTQLIIALRNGRWSYDIFRKGEIQENTLAGMDSIATSWSALVKSIELKNTRIFYDDGGNASLAMNVQNGRIEGLLTSDDIQSTLKLSGVLDSFTMAKNQFTNPIPLTVKGKYNFKNNTSEFDHWTIDVNNSSFNLDGSLQEDNKGNAIPDLLITWSGADPAVFKQFLPQPYAAKWKESEIKGKSAGKLIVKGDPSGNSDTRIILTSELQDGSISFVTNGSQLKNILLDLDYDSGENSKKSYLRAEVKQATYRGKKMKASFRMDNLDNPLMDMEISGTLPAAIMNLFMGDNGWTFGEGDFETESFTVNDLPSKTFTATSLIRKSNGRVQSDNVSMKFNENAIHIKNGGLTLKERGLMQLKVDQLSWNKATGEALEGTIQFEGDDAELNLSGRQSGGKITVKGVISNLSGKAVLNADWDIRGIEMKDLLTSFDNFDQTFITSEHVSGKADIYAHAVIPYDKSGHVLASQVDLKAAIDIDDGRLRNLKVLEDFSKYIHMDDLRDIRFNTLRNYLKIEGGKVFLPVMFIQSSAINLSIHGVHSFDHRILYNMKINAGQAATARLAKKDPLKKFKPARKSGWVNLYYVLSGTVDEVKYEQDQKQVISSFEQSSQLKENLRRYLVDRFGHQVYWVEPNEWEDIPEYK